LPEMDMRRVLVAVTEGGLAIKTKQSAVVRAQIW
jgi:hypothetical protein